MLRYAFDPTNIYFLGLAVNHPYPITVIVRATVTQGGKNLSTLHHPASAVVGSDFDSNFVTSRNENVGPFLKWAGGKRWLQPLALNLRSISIKRYYEPFVGSGAMFFALPISEAFLSDTNLELIDTYLALKNDWRSVENMLLKHHRRHCIDYYYEIRSSIPRKPHTKAARFIYLNRTCWNGLYRVNRSGIFNTPIGSKKNVILDTDDFRAVSERLRSASLVISDFETQIQQAGSGDLIFADPPYTVRHQFNGFRKYNEQIFSWEDQVRLRNSLVNAKKRGALIICTNADHQSIRDLYNDFFDLTPITRYSAISGDIASRGRFAELIISG